MREGLIIAALLLVGALNTLPVLGLLSAGRLQALYGVAIADPDLLLLMRHRALLFGLLGGMALASIALPALRLPAMLAVGLSMLGFVLLAGAPAELSAPLRKVYWIDVALCLVLLPALVLQWRAPSAGVTL
jgi:hypothetical protein